ncbi:MAG: chorismate synthase [Lachnospiraceae bacterium]|nr:chorismate synthase [Lachnospiraceae bacterium]
MAGSTFGNIFKIMTWGESHGEALGVVIDGCPAGLSLEASDIQTYLDRRKPGQSAITTPRKEADKVEILSGVFAGKTTGAPISLMIKNTNQISKDYDEIAAYYRPGHADFTYDAKYGFRDYRGGGRSSGRETIGRVAAGAVAAKILLELGIKISAFTYSIGPVICSAEPEVDEKVSPGDTSKRNDAHLCNSLLNEKVVKFINECKEKGDSVGSVVECRVSGVPIGKGAPVKNGVPGETSLPCGSPLPLGIGEPVFDKLDAKLAQAMMSIGAAKAVEIGAGCAVSEMYGSKNNDEFCVNDGKISKLTNHSGGTLGGISDGSDIILRVHFKPTPSISATQQTVDRHGQPTAVQIKGRHDPVIAPRAVVVVECMAAITMLDLMMTNMTSKLENLANFYK